MIRWLILLVGLVGVTAALSMSLPKRPTEFRWQPPTEKSVRSALHMPKNSSCRITYEALYEKPKIRIALVFGYKDARPARYVGDRYESAAIRRILTEPCPPGFGACGFQPLKQDGEWFRKRIVGPDRRARLVELLLVHSSAGPDDEENRKDPFQAWQSKHARDLFELSLKTSDIVFYNGHSRDGGGPDFDPPKMFEGHVNYDWYQIYKPGLKLMKKGLEGGTSKMVGLFSCVSDRYFSQEITKVRPELALITSDSLLYYTDSIKNLLGSLSSVLGMVCSEGFEKSIQAGDPIKGSRLQSFFKKENGE